MSPYNRHIVKVNDEIHVKTSDDACKVTYMSVPLGWQWGDEPRAPVSGMTITFLKSLKPLTAFTGSVFSGEQTILKTFLGKPMEKGNTKWDLWKRYHYSKKQTYLSLSR